MFSKFDSYFVLETNLVHERARFDKWLLYAVGIFIRAPYEMAQNWDFEKKDKRLRDQLVIGLKDNDILEKMQLQSDLTLDEAVQMAKQSELVRSQLKTLGEAEAAIEEVTNHKQ